MSCYRVGLDQMLTMRSDPLGGYVEASSRNRRRPRTSVLYERTAGTMLIMDSELEPGQPAPSRRAGRKSATNRAGLTVVGDEQAKAKPARRHRQARRKVVTREEILAAPMATQPIVGTELSVREQSVNETDAMVDDDSNKDLDDREFAVRTLARQLVGDPGPGVDDVRGWADDELLFGARAMLSFPPLKISINGVEQQPDPEDIVVIPDPLTFASFREAVTAVPKRWESKLAETARRITELGLPKMASTLDAATLAAIAGSGTAAFGQGSPMAQAMESLRDSPAFRVKVPEGLLNSPALKMKLPELDFMKGSIAGLGALTDTTSIAGSLAKYADRTVAMEKLAMPREIPAREPVALTSIKPYHPEVDAINALGGRIAAMAKNQAAADREALDVMTGQSELIRRQGEAIERVAAEVQGQRKDQRWPNRATYAIAVLTVLLLVAGTLAVYFAYLAISKP